MLILSSYSWANSLYPCETAFDLLIVVVFQLVGRIIQSTVWYPISNLDKVSLGFSIFLLIVGVWLSFSNWEFSSEVLPSSEVLNNSS